MQRPRHLLFSCLVLIQLAGAGGLLRAVDSASVPVAPYRATDTMAQETRFVVQLLENFHYLNTPVTEETFAKLIPEYMGDLDDQRLFFTEADKKQFVEAYGDNLGRKLREGGDLSPAFRIFEVFCQRVESRVAWIEEQLKTGLDFTADETYTYDRHELPWPATATEADALWLRRLKFEMLPELLDDKSLEEASETITKRYNRLLKNFRDLEAPEVQEIYLSTLTRLYDPHSTFFAAASHEDFSIQMRLSLIGIGALLASEDGYCVVKELMPGSPALLSGQLHPNDKIVAVAQDGGEDVDVIGMSLRKVVKLIRGEKGTTVNLTVVPKADATARKLVSLVRDVIKLNDSRARASVEQVPTPEGGSISIGVIDVPSFYGAVDEEPIEGEAPTSVTADVKELLEKLQKENVQGVVLDLRRNGGGLLSEAVSLTGLFITKGPVVAVRDSNGRIQLRPDTDPRVTYSGPLMVLTSRFSASASEIVAGALQDYGRAIIVGDRSTHGKGTVQAVYDMKGVMPEATYVGKTAAATKLTIQKFYLPSGASTQNRGVIPDVSLPAIEDFLPIGESDLPNSLPWDEIHAVRFNGRPLDGNLRGFLREETLGRVKSMDEFKFLQDRINWLHAREEQKEVSLNLEKRKSQKVEDKAFRDSMKARQTKLAESNFTTREILLDSVIAEQEAAKAQEAATTANEAVATDASTVAATENPAPEAGEAATPEATTAQADAPAENANPDDLDEEPDAPAFDVHLREALRILRDAVAVSANPSDWTSSTATIAALSRPRPTDTSVSKN